MEQMPSSVSDEESGKHALTDSGSVLESFKANQAVHNRTVIFIFLILFTGCAACAGFLGVTIASANDDSQSLFDRHASALVKEIEASWHDYEVAGLWIHEACRSGITRKGFKELYEYLESYGLEFQAIEFIPKVTHAERKALEEETRAFLAQEYPEINYRGFVGFEPVSPNSTEMSIQNRSEQPFYYVVHYVEPVTPNAAAIDLDLYSSSTRRETIDFALRTWKPALTDRLRLVQETDPSAYSVLLMHPGIPLDTEPDLTTKDLSLTVIRIPSLLDRASRFHQESLAAYVYDTTNEYDESPPQFLGGVEVHQEKNVRDEVESVEVIFVDEIEREELSKRKTSVNVFTASINIASSTWEITVLPLEGTYEARPVFEIFGGTMIFAACFCVALWMFTNMRRTEKINKIQAEAKVERAIVESLFPPTIRDRLIQDVEDQTREKYKHGSHNDSKLTADPESDENLVPAISSEIIFGSKPIADLIAEVTVMFADLVGFTAWSSARDPTQVFALLEIIYHSFDNIAKKRHVFKVETVGDCYVAVAGLPEARKDHAVIMAHFAAECMTKMHELSRSLEVTLGPDTADLDLRIGLHSGPVIAGVLRGDKGRFQLFGDTMNTASRMESNGQPSKIQASGDTASLLEAAGKQDWVILREDLVYAKGKGELRTFWIDVKGIKQNSSKSPASTRSFAQTQGEASKTCRELNKVRRDESDQRVNLVIDWIVEVISRMLREILAKRVPTAQKGHSTSRLRESLVRASEGKTVLDEMKNIIPLPEFHSKKVKNLHEPSSIHLDNDVVAEITDFVNVIADMYQNNPFHNFEHACHVLLSVTKLLGRIMNPRVDGVPSLSADEGEKSHEEIALEHHERTFGIASDPLMHFACVFSALIHDVDHPGVPNATLVKEESNLARVYKNKSVAEQNSVDLAWNILMSSRYRKFRECAFGSHEELLRFRQLVVNMVMATDVIDKDLGAIRKARWEKAFSDRRQSNGERDKKKERKEDSDRKATIVIEHLIQASDVSHTMQHWHVYRKWNERLFLEMYGAFKAGRLEKDPSVNWYSGEKSFFDFYIIPLAKNLDRCGVFGVTSDELRVFAEANRKEWDSKGEDMVKSFKEKYESMQKLKE